MKALSRASIISFLILSYNFARLWIDVSMGNVVLMVRGVSNVLPKTISLGDMPFVAI